MEDTFLELHKTKMETLGFWSQNYKQVLINQVMQMYKTEIIRDWCITDIIINSDTYLVKWIKRYEPLTAKELEEDFGRK